MKIRSDFVSNSSSTSYTVELNLPSSIKNWIKLYCKNDGGPEKFDYLLIDSRKIAYEKVNSRLRASLRQHLNEMSEPYYDYELSEILLGDNTPKIDQLNFIKVSAHSFLPYLKRVRNYGLAQIIIDAIVLIYAQSWFDLSYWNSTEEEPYQKLKDWLTKQGISYEHSEVHD